MTATARKIYTENAKGGHALSNELKTYGITLGEWLPQWLERYRVRIRNNTYTGYKVNIDNHIIPSLGKLRLTEITGIDLDKFYAAKLSVLSARSVSYIHAVLRTALNCATRPEWGVLLSQNPTMYAITNFKELIQSDDITRRGQPRSVRDPWDAKVLAHALVAIQNPRWQLLILLTTFYGLRRNEALGLCQEDVSEQKGVIHVWRQLAGSAHIRKELWAPLKTGKGGERFLPLIPETLSYFKAARQTVTTHLPTPGFVICKDDGSAYDPSYVSKKHASLLVQHKLPYVRLHDQRHATATNTYEHGYDELIVSNLLGHSTSSRNATPKYIKFKIAHMRVALQSYWDEVAAEIQRMEEHKCNAPQSHS